MGWFSRYSIQHACLKTQVQIPHISWAGMVALVITVLER